MGKQRKIKRRKKFMETLLASAQSNNVDKNLDQHKSSANTKLRFRRDEIGSFRGMFRGVKNSGNTICLGQESSIDDAAIKIKSFFF